MSKTSKSNATHANRVVLDLTEEQKRGLKLLAVARDTTVMDILRELVDRELGKKSGLEAARDAVKGALGRG